MQHRRKILIVDDNLLDRMISSRLVRLYVPDSDVILMDNAMDGLKYLDQSNGDVSALPYLIILDLDMPVLNGFGFLDHFSKHCESMKDTCKIVVLTGSEIESDLLKLKAHPCVSSLINKPLQRNSLAKILNSEVIDFPLS